MIRETAKKAGIDGEKLQQAMDTGDLNQVISGMNPDAASKLKSLLSDKEATEKILMSDQAKEFMKKFMGEK